MLKITVLYGHPVDVEVFENYYTKTHIPIAAKMKGVDKMELTKFISAVDGSKAPYYRMAEMYFTNPAEMQATMTSPEGQATVADLSNFATGGVTTIIGTVEN